MPTINITATEQQFARVGHCVGSALGLERDATIDEVQQFLIGYIKNVVASVEKQESTTNPLDLT